MKKSDKSRQRIDSVYGTVNVGDDRTVTVYYDRDTDRIEIVNAEEGSTKTERRYERASGKPKVVSSIPSGQTSAFDAKRALFTYDWAVAIDTNEFRSGDHRCAVCFSYYAQLPPYGFDGQIAYLPLGAFLIWGVAESTKSEPIGWHLTLTHDLALHRLHMGKIAIIVDSELSRHQAINTHQIGYYAQHILPANLTMVYASADIDKETLQGVMIRTCDRNASLIIEELQRTAKIPPLTANTTDENFSAFAPIIFRRR